MKVHIKIASLFLMAMVLCSCGKEYLDLQQQKNLRVPKSIDDYQKLLDQTGVITENSPTTFANISADDYFVPAAQYYQTTGAVAAAWQLNAYIWADQIYVGRETEIDWNKAYNAIYLANLGMEYIGKTPRETVDGAKWDLLKGTALFVRAINLYELSQVFCPVYSEANAGKPLGLSLREEPDPTVTVPRATVKETYDRIIAYLNDALTVLPDKPSDVYKPSKVAVYALLTRVYMQMENYPAAETAADKCLTLQSAVLDYNTVAITNGATLTFPLQGKNNPEVIYMESSFFATIFNFYNADITLLRTYEKGDLRMKVYYTDTTTSITGVSFKGSYKGKASSTPFTGLATDEVYLNRAESRARNQNLPGALSDLNLLRKARFPAASYVALASTDMDQVMKWILAERRRELVMRGTRWSDLRRLNKEQKYANTLKRVLNSETFELKPSDPKWVLPLPLEAIQNGKYEQNPR